MSRPTTRAPRLRRGARRVLALVVLAAALAGCSVDATVLVDARRDGSGVVRVRLVLDDDAVAAAEAGGGGLEERVPVDDLRTAGWRVTSWRRAPDGSAALVLSKPFARPEEVGPIVEEVAGHSGPLRDVRVTRDRGLLSTDYAFTGRAALRDLRPGVGDDPELAGRLAAAGFDPVDIERRLAAQLRDAFTLRVVVQLPGGATRVIEPATGRDTLLVASSSVGDTRRLVLLGVAAALALVGIVLVVRPHRRRGRAGTRAGGAGTVGAGRAPAGRGP